MSSFSRDWGPTRAGSQSDSNRARLASPLYVQSVNGFFSIPPASRSNFHSNYVPLSTTESSYIPRPKDHRWRDSICCWPKNLYPSCVFACCCCHGIYLVAQMAHKLKVANFQTIVTVYAGLLVGSVMLDIAFPHHGITIHYIPFVYALLCAIRLRIHIVRTFKINENAAFCEYVLGCCCHPCSIAQMARHLYGYRSVLDGDANPDRPDQYSAADTGIAGTGGSVHVSATNGTSASTGVGGDIRNNDSVGGEYCAPSAAMTGTSTATGCGNMNSSVTTTIPSIVHQQPPAPSAPIMMV